MRNRFRRTIRVVRSRYCTPEKMAALGIHSARRNRNNVGSARRVSHQDLKFWKFMDREDRQYWEGENGDPMHDHAEASL